MALCDEIILWFGVGPYVDKAMELKETYEPLTAAQQERRSIGIITRKSAPGSEELDEAQSVPEPEPPEEAEGPEENPEPEAPEEDCRRFPLPTTMSAALTRPPLRARIRRRRNSRRMSFGWRKRRRLPGDSGFRRHSGYALYAVHGGRKGGSGECHRLRPGSPRG